MTLDENQKRLLQKMIGIEKSREEEADKIIREQAASRQINYPTGSSSQSHVTNM